MTLPDERYRAARWAESFLQRLAGGEYPRTPKAVRDEARSILRHYPTQWDLQQLEQAAPHVIQRQMEPVTRLFKQYEQGKTNEA